MQRHLPHAIVFLIGGILWTTPAVAQEAAPAAAQQKAEAPAPLKPIERFDGKTAFRTKKGKPKELHVIVRNWEIHGRQRIKKFPEEGFMLVHLHSGKVTTVIDGKEEKWGGDAFWTVPAGSTISAQVTSESALLETMAVRNR